MRTKVLASLLILCGSTAAVASVTAMPQDTDAAANNSVLENKLEDPTPQPAPEPAPEPTTEAPAPTPGPSTTPPAPGETTPPQ